MPLSYDLISEFVKTTKVKPQPLKESTCYGTVVSKNGTDYVKLDGSDQLTPVNTNVVIHENDRVMVMIKNHTATVTGNETRKANQSSRKNDSGNFITLDDLAEGNVTRAEFDRLEAANLKVQNTLNAENGVVKTLESNTAYIKELKADNGIIESLQAEDGKINGTLAAHQAVIDGLDTTYAKIGQLNASNANITDLTTKVGKINTLIYGSASGEVIHTSFANSVIATLGDAWIDSAMIGSLNTSEVTIASGDDSLRISGNLIQFKDGNDVKMQLGKDAQGKYSVVLCDENGATLLDKDGIKANAVPDQLIVNDMVSNSANISASKLDIDSLFSEINGSVNTIKSTQVKLDEKNQTLDVAFKSLESTVTDQGETISSQGTSISTILGKIESKVWQQDIDTATNSMTTRYTTLEQNLNNFKTTVSETYATGSRVTTLEQAASGLTAKIDNIEIGGRNYIRLNKITSYPNYNSVSYDGTTISAKFNTSYTHNDEGGYLTLKIQGYTPPNKVMTLSGYIKVNGDIPSSKYFTTRLCTYSNDVIVDEYDPATGYFVSTQTYDGSSQWIIHGKTSRESGSADVVTFEKLKFELGNKATDWTPAPEDVESDILDASKTATNYLDFSSDGLVIGDMTVAELGKNALIDADGFKVRNGSTVNSFFGENIIELAKNSETAVISMLNDTFKIYYSADISEKGLGIYGKTSTGEYRLAFQPVNENNNLTIGWGGWNAGKNSTNIYGYNMNLITKNDMAFTVGGDLDVTSTATMEITSSGWKINDVGDLLSKYSNGSYVELIGLSSEGNTAIGHGGYSAALGKTNIYGNKIQHVVNTTTGSVTYKPYYEAGDSFELEWYGAGFVTSSSSKVYFTIPLAKPVIGATKPTVSISRTSGTGLRVRQGGNYVYGAASDTFAIPSSYKTDVSGDGNYIRIEATMANTTNAVNNESCGIHVKFTVTFS